MESGGEAKIVLMPRRQALGTDLGTDLGTVAMAI
jgi:hypothetical protein